MALSRRFSAIPLNNAAPLLSTVRLSRRTRIHDYKLTAIYAQNVPEEILHSPRLKQLPAVGL